MRGIAHKVECILHGSHRPSSHGYPSCSISLMHATAHLSPRRGRHQFLMHQGPHTSHSAHASSFKMRLIHGQGAPCISRVLIRGVVANA